MSLTFDIGKRHLLAGVSLKQIVRAALVGCTAISALAIAQPALAYTELGTTGTVGAHKLQDTEALPGGRCLFRHRSADDPYQLRHIYVEWPRMKAVSGMGTEEVAWSFTVQRRIVGFGGAGPWKDRYTSPKFESSTDSTHNAVFAAFEEGVKVVVPFAAGGDASANYRVIVKLFWYKSDGATILGTATDKVDWYYPDQGKAVPMFHNFCPDYD